jgi:hypothetical protein
MAAVDVHAGVAAQRRPAAPAARRAARRRLVASLACTPCLARPVGVLAAALPLGAALMAAVFAQLTG